MNNIIVPNMTGRQLRTDGHWSVDGLVFYPDFSGDTGNLPDLSPFGNDGTITGATWVGDGLNFNGSSDFVAAPNIPLGGATKFTAIFMVKVADASAGDEMIVEYTTNANTGGFYMDYISTKQVRFYAESETGGANSQWTTADDMVVGKWTHLAMTVDFNNAGGSEVLGYLNGVLNGANSGAGDNTGTLQVDTLYVGSRAGSSLWFGGDIADVKIYNRALSASEIQALYIDPDLPMARDPIWMMLSPDAGIVPIIQAHTRRRRAG